MVLGHALGLHSPKITVDPSNTGNVVRGLFAAESILNLLIAGWLLISPSHALSFLVSSPAQNTATAQTLTQWAGVNMLVVTIPLILGLPQSQRAIESRPTAWTTYVTAEVSILVFCYGLAGLGEEKIGVKPEVLRWVANQVIVPMIGRTVTLVWRPQWFGKYKVVEEGTKGQ
jgi:hypothetical protein